VGFFLSKNKVRQFHYNSCHIRPMQTKEQSDHTPRITTDLRLWFERSGYLLSYLSYFSYRFPGEKWGSNLKPKLTTSLHIPQFIIPHHLITQRCTISAVNRRHSDACTVYHTMCMLFYIIHIKFSVNDSCCSCISYMTHIFSKRPPSEVKLTTHLRLMPRLKMRETIPPLPPYVFIAWCLSNGYVFKAYYLVK